MAKNDSVGWRQIIMTGFKEGPPAAACRYALSPLTAGKDVEQSDELEVLLAAKGLLRQWRGRLLALQQAGWERLRDHEKLRSYGNCPPVGIVETKGGTFSCRQYRICPFCWCRQYVLELMARIQRLVRQYPKAGVPFDLVEVRMDRRYPVNDYAADVLFHWIRVGKNTYYRENLAEAYGGFVLCSVEPPNYSKPDPCFRLYHRVLALIPKRLPTPGEEVAALNESETQKVTRKVLRTSRLTEHSIAAAVGRVCLYPAQLMTGSAEETVEILNAQSMSIDHSGPHPKKVFPIRMSEFYGVLRRKTATPVPVEL